MKNFINKTFKYFIFLLAVTVVWTACRNDDDEKISTSAPTIDLVAASVDESGKPTDLSSVTVGYANNVYIIKGTGFATLKHVYFNDYESYFNPNLVTDNTIIVTINEKTPYANVNNKLKLVTKFGTIEYDFTVAPPAPVFKSFNPINAADGEEVTITGNYFLNSVVKVGDVEAEVISESLTEIKIKLPQGSQGKKITVTTLSGSNTWGTAIGTALFDDKFYSPWNIDSAQNHTFVNDASAAFQGSVFIKKEIDGWGSISTNWVWEEDAVKKYTGIKFAVRSDDDGKLELIFNNDWSDSEVRQFKTSKDWKEVKFTWSQLNNPAVLQNLAFKEFTGNKHNYYFDNITYTTD
ncbi:IPT/TIG domain-containing protein [Cloacibacterium sp.]|uniref:IPT/TIG domain-containing protein n=1 Tax=Cloacibacterium sp. TaxID=1913682 RepID=UPI0039E43B99